ncbi:oligosaccharide flippase family protein [Lapillicoccus jejuensis]|uniref:O-antigen/teichoic acid export membrane protein n=1 Tax=Lapillicoccus jejuensis TaxID=402171 RepID=A0A542E1U0_9MICO|nr:oligosaccharide flippase family protein [Lapillicoccus jejuensis]TQJ09184.1 O-antigen/teichoic acid export membrane protein [Lapillicoccus jejuensis]
MTVTARGGASRDGGTRERERMARGGGLNLVGAITTQACQLLIVVALAHLAGQREVGRYAVCFALVSLLGLLALAGFRAGLTRFVAMHLADGDAARLRGTVRLGLGITLGGSVVIAVALALLAPAVAGLMGDDSIVAGVRLVALSLVPSSLAEAALAATQGWRSQKAFTLIGRVFDPVSRLVLTVVLVALGHGYLGAMTALAATSFVTCALALAALARRMRRVERARPRHELGELMSFSMVSWLSALAATGLIWADTLILGAMRSEEEVGVYNVASRLVTLAVFVLPPITATFSPHMAHLYHVGDLDEAAKAYGAATRWTLLLSMPAFVLLLVFPGDLLQIFGRGYGEGVLVTVILAVGQLVGAAAGPCGIVLNMSGRVWLSLLDNGLVLVLNVGLNLALIPRFGIVGAAVAWSVSLVVVNLVKLVQARRVVGISPVGAMTGKILLAAFVAVCGGVLVQDLLTASWLVVVVAGAAVVGVIYVTLMVTLGTHPDDAAIARRLVLRRGTTRGRRPA